MMLVVRNLHTYYGLSHVLFSVGLTVDEGEVIALLGRNGAGKSTTLKSIMGLAAPASGSIQFKGQELRGLRPHQICQQGIGFVPEDAGGLANAKALEEMVKVWLALTQAHGRGVGFALSMG